MKRDFKEKRKTVVSYSPTPTSFLTQPEAHEHLSALFVAPRAPICIPFGAPEMEMSQDSHGNS